MIVVDATLVGDSVLLKIADEDRSVEFLIPREAAIDVSDMIEDVATGAHGDSLDRVIES